MTHTTHSPTTVSNIGVAMFAVADQEALAFYTEKLGFEVRSDTRFGEHDEMRWLEVALPGSRARLALNPADGWRAWRRLDRRGDPGRAVRARAPERHRRHRPRSEPMRTPGAPLMFMLRDPDGNHIAVVEEPPGLVADPGPSSPPFGLSQFAAFLRLGWTRGGSPGIFG